RGQGVLQSLGRTRTRPRACSLRGRPSRARAHVRAVSSAALQLRSWHPDVPSDSAPSSRKLLRTGAPEVLHGPRAVADAWPVVPRTMATDRVDRCLAARDV